MTVVAELCHAFVLHTRPYRERSRLAEFWTLEQGRISAVIRPQAPPLFQPCLVAWRGKTSLKTVSQCELAGLPLVLAGDSLFAGFYLNELLVRLLPPEEAQPALFALYAQSLTGLSERAPLEPLLRRFERSLLAVLGYALDCRQDSDGGPILPERHYGYYPERGFVALADLSGDTWPGAALLAMAADDYSAAATRQAAKRILRAALAQQLGGKPLKSRELWLKS